MSSPCVYAGRSGTKYTYAELEGLWIAAGGSRATAAVAAAIAEAESGGCSAAYNPSGATGLWQILGAPSGVPGNSFDPGTNARQAVAKYQQAGNSWSPWQTFTNGAYRAFLSGRTTPVTPAGITTTAATSNSSGTPDCLWSIGGGFGLLGSVNVCILSKSQARVLIGANLMLLGGFILLPSLALLAAGLNASLGRPLDRAAGGVTEGAGAVVSLFAPEVGVPLAAAGRTVKQQGATKAATSAARKRGERQLRERREEERDAERKAGNLGGEESARAGESPGFAARNRTASGRPRPESSRQRAARYGQSSGSPAPASETGF